MAALAGKKPRALTVSARCSRNGFDGLLGSSSARLASHSGLDPESWARCRFGYAASVSVAEAAVS